MNFDEMIAKLGDSDKEILMLTARVLSRDIEGMIVIAAEEDFGDRTATHQIMVSRDLDQHKAIGYLESAKFEASAIIHAKSQAER